MIARLCWITMMLGASTLAWAGDAQGEIGKVLVGRLGSQVYVELLNASVNGWPCASTHPGGYGYAFLLSATGGKEMLATVLAAKAAGQRVQIVDSGSCTIDPSIANANYVVAL